VAVPRKKHKKASRNKENHVPEKPSKSESKTSVAVVTGSIDEPSPVDNNDWIVVKENKKNRRSPAVVTAPKPVPNKQTTKTATKKTPMMKTAKKKTPKTTTTTEKKAWSDIVSQDMQTVNSSEDVPCLSDSESIAGSIESPSLSTRGLIHEEEPTYYSPFSTGFDLGAIVEKSRPGRLDKYLLSQRWNKPSNHTSSLLNLLNQTDQVETSITANSFQYFDEMMMSNSLYKPTTVAEQDDEWIRNRQNWYSTAF
jgi:hypothetical protein